jgi:hypothetical protein
LSAHLASGASRRPASPGLFGTLQHSYERLEVTRMIFFHILIANQFPLPRIPAEHDE